MKKMLLAVLGLLSFASLVDARGFGGRCGKSCGPCAAPACAPACAPQCPVIPRCFKTIELPAIERRVKQPDVCERIPQPDCVKYVAQKPIVIQRAPICVRTKVADKVVWHKQPDIVTFECPCGTTANGC